MRIAVVAAWAVLFAAAGAGAQGEGGGVGAVPPGPAAVAGRVVAGDPPVGVAGVDVVLYALAADGQPGIARSVTDAAGDFRFDGVAREPVYLLGARYDEVPFVGERVVFAPDEVERRVTIRVSERARSAADLTVTELRLQVGRFGAEIAVRELARLSNGGAMVLYATAAEREAGAEPLLRARLPAGVTDFSLPYAVPPEGLVREGDDVRFYGPVYPGDQEIAFGYTVPASGDWSLTRGFPTGVERVTVVAPEGLELRVPGLAPGEPTEIEGVPHRVWSGGPLRAGASLALAGSLPAASSDPAALSLTWARAFLELDDAALSVDEQYNLEVDGEAELVAASDAPLLRVPIPADARDVRFGASAGAAAVGFDEENLVVRGPLPPGPSEVRLRYRLPAAPEGAAFVRRFEAQVPTLTVYVADTGLEVRSDRLHRRRPVKTPGERLFMHFEAFFVEPGEVVDLEMRPLRRSGAYGPALRGLFVVGGALGIAFFLSGPLRGRGASGADAARPSHPARQEREALYAALRDLDHDFETGKLSEADYEPMREELRARAAALIRAEQGSSPELESTP